MTRDEMLQAAVRAGKRTIFDRRRCADLLTGDLLRSTPYMREARHSDGTTALVVVFEGAIAPGLDALARGLDARADPA